MQRLIPPIAAALMLSLCLPASAASRAAVEKQFTAWLAGTVWPDAKRQGVSRAVFTTATKGLTPDWKLPDLVPPGGKPPEKQYQAEFRSPAAYFRESAVGSVVNGGLKRMRQWSKTLNALEAQYGVWASVIVAVWGRESAFGNAALPKNAVRTLATKAFMSTRRDFFYPELIAALKIMQTEGLSRQALKSSWAGALGQPQFMPSKFIGFAIDHDGNGKRDIWKSVPDTLASIGFYLQAHGWRKDVNWGVEVKLPDSVSCTLAGPEQGRRISAWEKDGVKPVAGGRLRDAGIGKTCYLMMPAGRYGPAFIVSDNFNVLKLYNESDLYAAFIGHAADRMAGRVNGPFRTAWRAPSGFTRGDVRRMQQRLEAQGHDVGGADGLIGFNTRIAVGKWQQRNGKRVTCFPSKAEVKGIR